MIELPASPAPNFMEPALLDYGSVQRGASAIRIDRPGSRFRIAFGLPPMQPDVSRQFIAKLLRAKRAGLRVELPLLIDQGAPGMPVIDGAGHAGSFFALRGLNPGYVVEAGYWLNIVEAATGTSYLHKVHETVTADWAGKAIVEVDPTLRAPFADGDRVELAAPWIEGFVDGDEWAWQVPLHHLIALQFPVEEYR